MRTSKPIALLLVAVITGYAYTGCYKVIDYAWQHKGDEMKLCRIEKIVINQNDNNTITVSYNANNDPISIKLGSLTYIPLEYYFRYDQQHRLTDYMMAYYQMTGAMVWHRYSYPNTRTVIDSQFNYVGDITGPPPHSGITSYVTKFTLDAWGRIVQQSDMAGLYPTNYTYDSKGNLVRPDVTYDNKINIFRTSKTWMFINNDYSMNNALAATDRIDTYSAYGLPLHYASSAESPGGQLFGYYYHTASIVYDCNGSYLPPPEQIAITGH